MIDFAKTIKKSHGHLVASECLASRQHCRESPLTLWKNVHALSDRPHKRRQHQKLIAVTVVVRHEARIRVIADAK